MTIFDEYFIKIFRFYDFLCFEQIYHCTIVHNHKAQHNRYIELIKIVLVAIMNYT